MRTSTITICGTPEESKEVKFQYEHYPVRKWLSDDRSTFFVNYVKILEPIPFQPSDLIEDLYHAVAEDLGEHPQDIRVDCDPEYSVKPVRTFILEPSYKTEMMFV